MQNSSYMATFHPEYEAIQHRGAQSDQPQPIYASINSINV